VSSATCDLRLDIVAKIGSNRPNKRPSLNGGARTADGSWRPITRLTVTPSLDAASYAVTDAIEVVAACKNLGDDDCAPAWGLPPPERTAYFKTRIGLQQ
jgi:hypothetical protein